MVRGFAIVHERIPMPGVMILLAVVVFVLSLQACAPTSHGLDGHWKLVAEQSSSIDPWRSVVLDISRSPDSISIRKTYSAGSYDRRVDLMVVNTKGIEQVVPVPPGRWLGQVSMGVYYGPGATRTVKARWSENGELIMEIRETVQTAQGESLIESQQTFAIQPDGTLKIHEERSTRSSVSMNWIFTHERMEG